MTIPILHLVKCEIQTFKTLPQCLFPLCEDIRKELLIRITSDVSNGT